MQPIQPILLDRTEQHESSSLGNTIDSLFDMPILSSGTAPEEEAFRRQMQRKKKKQGIRF